MENSIRGNGVSFYSDLQKIAVEYDVLDIFPRNAGSLLRVKRL